MLDAVTHTLIFSVPAAETADAESVARVEAPAPIQKLLDEFKEVVGATFSDLKPQHGMEHHIVMTGPLVHAKYWQRDPAKLAAAKAAAEEAAKLAAEKAAAEEAKRLAAEKAATEEAKRLAKEKAAAEEARLGTKPKTEPLKINKNQEQTGLNKKTKQALGCNTPIEMDVSAHLKENNMPHESESNQTSSYWAVQGKGLRNLNL